MRDELEKLFRHSAVFLVGLLFQRAAKFLLLPIYWSAFPPTLFGLLELFEIFIQVMTLTFAFALPSAYVKFYRVDVRGGVAEESLRGTTAALTGMAMVLLAVAIVALRSPLSWLFFKGTYPRLYAMAGFAVACSIAFLMVQSSLRARGRAVLFVTLSCGQFLLLMFFNIYFIKWRGMAVDGVLLSLILGWGIPTLVYVVACAPRLRMRFDPDLARRLVRFALPLVPFSIIWFVMMISGRLFLQHFHGTGPVGIFSAANRVALIMMLLCVTPFQTAWGYLGLDFTQRQDAARILSRTFTYLLVLGLWAFLLVSAVGREMIMLFGKTYYLPALAYVDLLTLGYLMLLFFYWANIALVSRDMTVRVLVISLPPFVLAIGGGWLAIPRHGIWAACMVFAAATALHAALTAAFSRRVVDYRLEWRRVAKVLAAFAFVYGAGRATGLGTPALTVAVASLQVGGFPLLLWAMGFLTRGEIERMRELFSLATGRAGRAG